MTLLKPNQRSQLTTIGIDGTDPLILFETEELIEAPNWTPDGRFLVFNAGGDLYMIDATRAAKPRKIPVEHVHTFNNDHVISPDGKHIYGSASGHIYRLPVLGGVASKVSNDHDSSRCFNYFLHGVSSDEKQLAYVAVESDGQDRFGIRRIATLDLITGLDAYHTGTDMIADGPEYSPDDRWIYFNMTAVGKTPEHQIYRILAGDGTVEQLTADERSNWFPHVSPDGKWVAYISFPPGTAGHPGNLDILIKIMSSEGANARTLVSVFGGQGTMNVNSWSPDSRRLAYVAYPIARAAQL
jgi:Tol biopolymer transport system component